MDEGEALARLAAPYGPAARGMIAFWEHSSAAIELFPWDTSWLIREIGKSDPVHAMTAACIHGVPWHTPSWASTRRAVYMQVDPGEVDPWMLEDVQLRCELAAQRMAAALAVAAEIDAEVPAALASDFARNVAELRELRRRTVAYALHLRETNLVTTMRVCRAQGREIPQRTLAELQRGPHGRPGEPGTARAGGRCATPPRRGRGRVSEHLLHRRPRPPLEGQLQPHLPLVCNAEFGG